MWRRFDPDASGTIELDELGVAGGLLDFIQTSFGRTVEEVEEEPIPDIRLGPGVVGGCAYHPPSRSTNHAIKFSS